MAIAHNMKKQTSKVFRGIALLYSGFPFTFMTAAIVLFDIPLKDLPPLFIGLGFWFLSACSLVVAYGLIEAERWAWHSFLVLNLMISFYAASLAFNHGTSEYIPISLLFFLLGQGILIINITKELRVPYFLPQIRWWESNPLLKITYPATIQRKSGDIEKAEILDLSATGCFLKSPHAFTLEEEIKLESFLFQVPLTIDASVVWKAKESVTHPKGIGVRFQFSNKKQRKLLFAVGHRFKEIKKMFRRSRYLINEGDFYKNLKELQTKPIKDLEKA